MKAIVYEQYGAPGALELREVARPVPGDGEVLVRVHAASINPWDWDLLRGKPFLVRLSGLTRPKFQILGADVAGRVEAVGRNVTRLQRGEAVFGDLSSAAWGGFAEYACAPEHLLARKPADLSFQQAAAIPQAALLALQGLRDKRKLEPGDRVLINGGGGGVGTFAIQLAKRFGAEVTAVDHGAKLDALRALGADHVIDYTESDFTATGARYDLILDVVARRGLFDYARALRTGGTFVFIGGSMGLIGQILLLGPFVAALKKKRATILAWHPNSGDLDHLAALVERRQIAPVIDRSYPLAETAEAFRYFGQGRATGKVVITVHADGAP